MKITYSAEGFVLGNCWGGGKCGYKARSFKNDDLEILKADITKAIKDGSIDSGMGYESIIGASMAITTKSSTEIDGKAFTNEEVEIVSFGDLTEAQEEFLFDAFSSL